MSVKEPEVVTPGDRIGLTSEFAAGSGCYILNKIIYASVVGERSVAPALEENALPVVYVQQKKKASVVPEIGDVVTCKVTKINPRVAVVQILCVGTRLLVEPFPGTIRQHDVRSFDVDTVEIFNSYRPGDIVLAQVLSLGDAKSYFLSTAKNELGVISANGRAGVPMVPVSWEQMQCPVTKAKEFRKVAKTDTSDQMEAVTA